MSEPIDVPVDRLAETTCAALLEMGRRDLAELVQYLADDPSNIDTLWSLEPLDNVSDADWGIMLRAEQVARGG